MDITNNYKKKYNSIEVDYNKNKRKIYEKDIIKGMGLKKVNKRKRKKKNNKSNNDNNSSNSSIDFDNIKSNKVSLQGSANGISLQGSSTESNNVSLQAGSSNNNNTTMYKALFNIDKVIDDIQQNRQQYINSKIDIIYKLKLKFDEIDNIMASTKNISKIQPKYIDYLLTMILEGIKNCLNINQIKNNLLTFNHYFGILIKYVNNTSIRVFMIALYISITFLICRDIRRGSNYILIDSSKKWKKSCTVYMVRNCINQEIKYFYIESIRNNKRLFKTYGIVNIDSSYFNRVYKIPDITSDIKHIISKFNIKFVGLVADHVYLKMGSVIIDDDIKEDGNDESIKPPKKDDLYCNNLQNIFDDFKLGGNDDNSNNIDIKNDSKNGCNNKDSNINSKMDMDSNINGNDISNKSLSNVLLQDTKTKPTIWCFDHKRSLNISFIFFNKTLLECINTINNLLNLITNSLILSNNYALYNDIIDTLSEFKCIKLVTLLKMQWQYLYHVLRVTLHNRVQIIVMIQQVINNTFAVRADQKRKASKIYNDIKNVNWWLIIASVMDIIAQLHDIQFGELNNIHNYVESIMQWRAAIVCVYGCIDTYLY